MTGEVSLEPIQIAFDVDCEPEHAFDIWTSRTSMWWPSTHTVSGEQGLDVVFEPHVGGRIFERSRSGAEHDWGRVTAWEAPTRIVYEWHLRADREDATEVEIRFASGESGRTRVSIEHRGWERLGAHGLTRREGNLAGWGGLLPHYQEFVKAAL
jgi:uncharacterized protein YndB with AHSA1/START domain